jgi:hypothetical protein
MKSKVLVKFSALIDKVGIDVDDLKVVAKDSSEESLKEAQSEVGRKLILKIVKATHKAENELYELISAYKDCTIDEAKEEDVIKIIKDIMSDGDAKDFFT